MLGIANRKLVFRQPGPGDLKDLKKHRGMGETIAGRPPFNLGVAYGVRFRK